MKNSSVCRHLLWKCSFMSFLMILQYIPGSSGFSMVSWCYWVDCNPPPPVRLRLFGVSRFAGGGVFLRYWVF